ncbi:MAG: succinyl-diaminopimelate desuccinylase [Piscirickettsiaceae bacterium CG_4_9_14_3_um_filter_43_564]|nr:succinyl-diaminopimelate desuccinylase [Thiomicrospira sp.]OIP94268.1 MAG: succinyl-diaminopimelate desuccinylase [Thiomicrospira sp. CG2_30_44_34]PIQ02784.1 MAG: succinyl-diaminopimelate desuccinylase [Piscirickettsiaceae bacterium CG18_big_fil_WC_8_21_14_2_50_44_103]PIU38598.1 MAG: succinyl-diaminopimelate desuccinylase [Piscirickettsiaceae bacterium CG07_land_8_20_14_0_80_44_28]PIW58454.1 MAG: succinyl-diaminopimelate desuccinylase [Piscirickettsiaceae bacterium CG12_big_fil_rev_8_21_14_0
MTETIPLAQSLIQIESITPNDYGCQTLIAEYLRPLGFNIEPMPFGEVTNLWARRGQTNPLFVFAGHTDVVPTGPASQWTHPPFSAHIDDNGMLNGRGSADMKSSIACFMVAVKQFINQYPDAPGSIGFLITSDEEGPAVNGTVKVIETLEARQEKIDYCLVGEPSSSQTLADSIKNGRRGSLNGKLVIHGKQGHIAYPQLARNPIHEVAQALCSLTEQTWDNGNDYFPPTALQISNFHAGTGATNVIPGNCEIDFNFRFSTEQTPDSLKQRVHSILEGYGLQYDLQWTLSGLPFSTPSDGKLIEAVSKAVSKIMGTPPQLSTAGGTSDGRFIAPTGAQVIELGPLNTTIHQVDERVSCNDLEKLTQIYYEILIQLMVA